MTVVYSARSDSATARSAWAAIVSAGFIAADEGKKPAVDHPQVLELVRPAPRVEHAGRRVGAGDHRAALVAVHADVERAA